MQHTMGTRSSRRAQPRTVPLRGFQALCLVQGAAFLALVGGGSPVWQIARMLLVALVTVILVATAARLDPAARARAALVVGIVGTSAGIGVGLRHLVATGWSARSVGGIVALATGVILVAGGGLALVRRMRGWRRLWAVPVAVAVAVFAIYPLSIAAMVANVPPSNVGSATPADRGFDFEVAEFDTADGVDLSGWYIPSANGAGVVLLHGAGGSTRSNVLDHASVLARYGYGVLLFDSRGHGDSGGVGMDWGWYGDYEVEAAVSYLLTRPDVSPDRIAVVGLSMGGEQALGALRSDVPIATVVAEGVTGRWVADQGWLPKPQGWVNVAAGWLMAGAADLLTNARPPVELRSAISSASRPILLIASGQSESEVLAAEYFRSAAPDDVEVWIARNAGHGWALRSHPQRWEATVVDFLGRSLPQR